MRSCAGPINTFFMVIGLLLTGSCASTSSGKDDGKAPKDALSVIQVYGETDPSPDWRARKIQVIRNAPVELNIAREPFLTEADVARAQVIESVGGFAIAIEFTSHGLLALHMETSSLRGRHLAIYGRWNEKKVAMQRWLAAPLITRPVENGVLAFTPDCTREEADLFVLGLNNTAIKLENQAKPGKKPKAKD